MNMRVVKGEELSWKGGAVEPMRKALVAEQAGLDIYPWGGPIDLYSSRPEDWYIRLL